MSKSSHRLPALPTPNEAAILQLIWQNGPLTVRQLTQLLLPVRRLAYTTVLTIVNVLCRKGWLTKTRVGRADVYEATVVLEQARGMILKQIVDRFFNGSVSELQACAITLDSLPPVELPRLSELTSRRDLGNSDGHDVKGLRRDERPSPPATISVDLL